MPTSISASIRGILERYNAEKQLFGGVKNSEHPVKLLFAQLVESISNSEPVKSRTAKVQRHMGPKKWRDVPLVEIGGSTSQEIKDDSVRVRLIFASDMSRAYLTVSAEDGRAAHYRGIAQDRAVLQAPDFSIVPRLQLLAKSAREKERESDNVLARSYDRNSVPDDAVIIGDIESAMRARDFIQKSAT